MCGMADSEASSLEEKSGRTMRTGRMDDKEQMSVLSGVRGCLQLQGPGNSKGN